MISWLVKGGILACAVNTEKTDILQSETSQYTRIVAIGDLHADLGTTVDVFKMASLIDSNKKWIGGKSIVVQTGDLTDRGADGKETLELIKRLQLEASEAGGKLISLIGNHEAMNVMGDWRYVSKGDIQSFGGLENRKQAFVAGGDWREWILDQKITAIVDDTVFVHGGISEQYAQLGVEGINNQAIDALTKGIKAPILSSEGPLWYRAYLQAPESIACDELDRALKSLNAKRMVVGHTTQRDGKVAVRCQGRLLGIDTGISKHYGSHLSFVEFTATSAHIVYPTGRQIIKASK
ncbi:MAG: metallophosphoesterase [Myxococcota bacterium]|nr:metallophosphoesterase [Myxococcota bacterium]